MFVVLSGVSVLAAASCGGGSEGAGGSGGPGTPAVVCDAGHCDGAAEGDCVQYGDATAGIDPYRQTCVRAGATWGDGPCRARGPGGCRAIDGTACVTFWYSSSFTEADAREACQGNGTFVLP